MADDQSRGREVRSGAVCEPPPDERAGGGAMTRATWVRIAAIGAATLSISGLHFLVDARLFMWHNILHHLYLLPIGYAALRFGWRGGLFATAFASVTFLPHVFRTMAVQPFPGYLLSRIMALVEYFAAAAVVGILSEKDRRQGRILSQLYRELQGSFERMKRSERLYAIGQLAAGLAHEIRNPIASIVGAAGTLQRNPDADHRRGECLEIISQEATRLNRLLTAFLDFAKPRPPQFQTVRVEPIVDTVLELGAHATGRQPVKLRKNIGPGVSQLECDTEQIKQVLLNLLLNAIQAMQQGGEIEVSAQRRNGDVVFAVRDQGCGISPENLKRLFDPFFTTKDTGTGLGLPVSHQIVTLHGGSMWADPNPGGGMTFSFNLPVRRQEAP